MQTQWHSDAVTYDTTKWWKDIPTLFFFVFANIATSNLAIDLM